MNTLDWAMAAQAIIVIAGIAAVFAAMGGV
jgi:hypothetical protein